jgi:hypothetical protein
MNMRSLTILLAVIVGCEKSNPTAPSQPVVSAPRAPEVQAAPNTVDPTEAKIKRDLVGQRFWYDLMNPSFGGSKWTIMDGQIMGAPEIKDRFTDSIAGTQEIEVFLTLSNKLQSPPGETIQGVLVMIYHKYDQGWRLQSVYPKAGGRPSFPSTDWGNERFTWKTSK